jgi:hypothetical protein
MATNLRTLNRNLQNCVARSPGKYAASNQVRREDYIAEVMNSGGKGFVDRVRKFGTTEKGAPLNLTPGYAEYLELLGDYRVKKVLISGCAQSGKTLANLLLMTDAITTGKLNAAWFYASRTALDQMVPIQFHPLARLWIANMKEAGHRFRLLNDRTVNTRFQVDGANAIFSYVSTSKQGRAATGKAAVGGVAASFQADFLILEERSQYGQGEADVTYDRIANSLIPTKPVRQLGTPGGGMGIEAEMMDCDYNFYPHYTCTSCGETHALDPKGCLLREVERADLQGNVIKSHLSESGRPVLWWKTEGEDDETKAAYVGCSNCGHPIPMPDRLNAAFRCTLTGITLRTFLDSLAPGIPDRMYSVGINLSPLCRNDQFIAEDLIRKGLDAENTANWQQQALGHPSESDTLHLTLNMLRDRIGTVPPPNRERNFRLCGIDVGRAEDWLMIVDYYLPPLDRGLSLAQIYEQTVRQVVYGADVVRSHIPHLLQEWYVEYGLIDNEPSRESSINLCRSTCLDMGNQAGHLKDAVHSKITQDGGISYPCWDLRIEKFMLAVFQGFTLKGWDGETCYRLPAGWDRWVGNPTERSPLVHLAAPWRDDKGSWQRGKNNLDDFYMALFFCEAAFYLKLMSEYGNPVPQAAVSTYRVG